MHIYKRPRSRFCQCETFLNGKKQRISSEEEGVHDAKIFAEEWYLTLRGRSFRGEPVAERTFAETAEQFLKDFELITGGDRSPDYIANMERQRALYVLPFMGEKGLSQITSGLVQE